jgi:type IV secretory pathway TrbD component
MGPAVRLIPVAAEVPAAVVRAAVADRVRYEVTVRTPDGERRTFEVGKGLYDRARPGAAGYAEMWRGHVTRLTVGSESKEIPRFRAFFFSWLLAWAGAMLVLGALFHPIGAVSAPVLGGGYVAGAVAFYVLRDWPPALFGVPAVVAAAVAVWWAAESRRRRRARRARPVT